MFPACTVDTGFVVATASEDVSASSSFSIFSAV